MKPTSANRYLRANGPYATHHSIRCVGRALAMSSLLAMVSSPSASAAPKYWDTATTANLQSGNGTWDTGTTSIWSTVTTGSNPLVMFIAGDDVFFQTTGANIITLGGNVVANSIVQATNGTATTINTGVGTQITLSNGNLTNSGNSAFTINPDIVLGATGTFNSANTITLGGVLSGSGFGFNKTGTGTVALTNAANSYSGLSTVSQGIVSFTGAATSATPFGTGSITLAGSGSSASSTGSSLLSLATSAASGNVSLTGGTTSGSQFSFSNTGYVLLAQGTSTSQTFTFGPGSGTVLNRVGQGVLVLSTGGSLPTTSTLGSATGNRFIVSGTTPTVTNGMVAPFYLGATNGGGGAATFLTYGANGFTPIAYDITGSGFGASTSTSKVSLTGTPAIAADAAAYALAINGATNLNSGVTVTLGDNGVTAAGLILNNSLSGGSVDFRASEGIVYVGGTSQTVSTAFKGSGGLTKTQYNGTNGVLTLTGANTYTGATTITAGNLTVGVGGSLNTASAVNVQGAASFTNNGTVGNVAVTNGGTATLNGGSTTGNVTAANGSTTILNGGSTTGTVTTAGNLTLAGTTALTALGNVSTSGTSTASITNANTLAAGNIVNLSGTNSFSNLTNSAAGGKLILTGVGSTNSFTGNFQGNNASSLTEFKSGTYSFVAPGNSGGNSIGNMSVTGATVNFAGGRYFASGGGTLNVSAGSFNVTGDRWDNTSQPINSTIIYNLSGSGLIDIYGINQNLGIGGTNTGTTNTVNQSGGTFQAGVDGTATTSLNIGGTQTNAVAAYNLSGGALRSSLTIQAGGAAGTGGKNSFNWTGGTLTAAAINVTNLTNNNGISPEATGTLFQNGIMAPGFTTTFTAGNQTAGTLYTGRTAITGNYQIDAGSVNIGIGGTTAATGFRNSATGTYDNISVTGSTVLGGRLNVALNNAYTPPNNATQLYNIVVGSASGVTGAFTNQQVATSGNRRVVLADGLSSFLIANNNTAAAATTGGLTTVGARTVALGGYQAGNTYSGAGTAWDTANAAAWTNFDPGATATPAIQASGAIAQFADGTASIGAIGVSLNSTRNIQGIQFSSASGSRAYTISQGGSGAIILDNTGNSASATIADTSTSGTANAINVPITLNSDLAVSVANAGSGSLSLGGVISGTGKSLTKSGLGNLTLTGANTYTGATTVSAGKLSVSTIGTINNTSGVSIGAGEFSYNNSTVALSPTISFSTSAGTLSGTGTITPAVIITSGNRQTAGTSVTATNATAVVGKETFTTSITYNQGSIFEWNLNADNVAGTGARGSAYDAVNTGGLATTGEKAIFRVILNGTDNFSEAFWNTDRTWADIFTGLDGSSVLNIANVFKSSVEYYNSAGLVANTNSSRSFSISGNTLSWSAVPEPTSALAGLLIGAGLLRRRRA